MYRRYSSRSDVHVMHAIYIYMLIIFTQLVYIRGGGVEKYTTNNNIILVKNYNIQCSPLNAVKIKKKFKFY